MTVAESPRFKVLVADDDPIALKIMASQLRARFEVTEAHDGVEAVEAFKRDRFDIVLLDVNMPNKTGVEAAEEIRRIHRGHFMGIMLISALNEVSTVIEGLGRGADDFLPKPFNVKIFDSKFGVFLRIRDAQRRLRDQNAALARFQEQTESEHLLAHEVFERILARGGQGEQQVRVSASALTMFNGDITLTARTPSGRFRWLLADVAGHGLVGAIGTVPLSSLFYRSAKVDRSLIETMRRINEELHESLPRSLFSACLAFELDPSRTRLSVINFGMPDAYVLAPDRSLRVATSHNLPLSVLPDLDPVVEEYEVVPGTRVFAVSDGIVECAAPSGEMFGSERLQTLLRESQSDEAFDQVLEQVRAFSEGSQSDDVSVVEVVV